MMEYGRIHAGIFFLTLLATMLTGISPLAAQEATIIEYTVGIGDTLDTIAREFLPHSWGDSNQAFAEFREGIFEYNFDRIFWGRKPYEVREGDCLLIAIF